MLGLLRTIAIIIIVYYVIKIVSRFMLPIVANKFMQKMDEKMRNAQEGFKQEEKKPVGETSIDKKTTVKSSKNDVGEYVDFEEIE